MTYSCCLVFVNPSSEFGRRAVQADLDSAVASYLGLKPAVNNRADTQRALRLPSVRERADLPHAAFRKCAAKVKSTYQSHFFIRRSSPSAHARATA
jgi:hypothetical protein